MSQTRDWLDDFEAGINLAAKLPPEQEAIVAAKWAEAEKPKLAKPVATVPPPPMRPLPASGQVWSTATPKGRRFIAILGVEQGAAESIEVTPEGVPVADNVLRGRALRTALDSGELPFAYRYEPTVTSVDTTPDEGTSRAARRKENPMSTNHAETTPTPETKPTTKKVPNLNTPRGVPANGVLTDPTPKAAKVAKPKAAKKAKPAPKATAKKAAPKAAPKAKATKSERITDEKVKAFMVAFLKKEGDEANRSTAIKAFRDAGLVGGEIRLRTLFDEVLAAKK